MTFDLLRYQAFFGVIAIAAFVPAHLRWRYGFAAWALWSYVLISAAFGFLNPEGRYGDALDIRLDQSTGRAFAVALLAPLFILRLQIRGILALLRWVEVFAVLNGLLIIWCGYGIFNNPAMDASVVAAMMPIILFRPSRQDFDDDGRIRVISWRSVWSLVAVGVPFIAIAIAHSATAIFVLFAGALAYAIARKHAVAALGGVSVLILGSITQGPDLIDSSGRFTQWKIAMGWWWEHANRLFGTGIGTYEWIGPSFRTVDKHAFIFMHSEPLQVLFEGGVVALVLSAAVYFRVLSRAWGRPWLVSTIVAMTVLSLTQFPLRFFVSTIFVLLVARVALENIGEDSKCQPQS